MSLTEVQPVVAPPSPEATGASDLRDPLVDPLAADGDAVQLDDASAFSGTDTFGAGWQKGRAKEEGGVGSSIQVHADWKGDGS